MASSAPLSSSRPRKARMAARTSPFSTGIVVFMDAPCQSLALPRSHHGYGHGVRILRDERSHRPVFAGRIWPKLSHRRNHLADRAGELLPLAGADPAQPDAAFVEARRFQDLVQRHVAPPALFISGLFVA